jgi:hypothetical protein
MQQRNILEFLTETVRDHRGVRPSPSLLLQAHKGLKHLYEDEDPRGVMAEHGIKLRDILVRLDAAGTLADMDV